MKYTPEQDAIINSNDEQIRVVAGPGSGKTSTIVARINKLLTRGVEPENIFVFCFAKHDKQNVISRLKRVGTEDYIIRRLFINNYHGFSLNLIRQFGIFDKAGSEIKLLEESESYTFIRKELELIYQKQTGTDKEASFLFKKAKRFGIPDAVFEILNNVRDEYFIKLENFKDIYSDVKYQAFVDRISEKIEEIEKLASKEDDAEMDLADYVLLSAGDIIRIAERYAEYCRTHGYIDFMDMILRAFYLLKDNQKILQDVSSQIKQLMVDEFQDISPLQFELICLLASVNQNILTVGDIDQCVYEWRNAKPTYMKDILPLRFKNLKTYNLSVNFRSDANIIQCANELIKNNRERLEFTLQAHFPAKEQVLARKSASIMEQANDVAVLVEGLLGGRPNYYTEGDHKVAIIVRSARSVSANLIRNALFKKQIPVQLRFESKIVEKIMRIVCSVCNLVIDPKSPADLAAILSIIPGFGEKTMDKLREELNKGIPLVESAQNSKIKGDKLSQVRALENYVLEMNSEYLKNEAIQISELKIFQRSFTLVQFLQDNFSQGKGALENTSLIDTTIEEIKTTEEKFIDYRDTLTSGLAVLNNIESGRKPSVLLCTSHHAKGGEWDYVICPDLVNGSGFPMGRNDESEEERRIFYVAITRAKQKLYLYSYSLDIQRTPVGSSPYLREMGIYGTAPAPKGPSGGGGNGYRPLGSSYVQDYKKPTTVIRRGGK